MAADSIWLNIFQLLPQQDYVCLMAASRYYHKLSQHPAASLLKLKWYARNRKTSDDKEACSLLQRYRLRDGEFKFVDIKSVIPVLCSVTSLRTLTIACYRTIFSSDLTQLTQLTQLHSLKVHHFRNDVPFEIPTSLRNLHVRTLENHQLHRLSQLTSLTVDFFRAPIHHNHVPLTIAALATFPLQRLSLPNYSLDNHTLSYITELMCKSCISLVAPCLVTLHIKRSTDLTSLAQLTTLRNLTVEYKRPSRITLPATLPEQLAILTQVTNITVIIGRFTTCDQVTLDALQELKGVMVNQEPPQLMKREILRRT